MKSTQTKTLVAVAAGLVLLTLPIAPFAGNDAGTLLQIEMRLMETTRLLPPGI